MIIWINGAFGSGKTSAAYELHTRLENSAVFDPENFGYFLRKNMPRQAWKSTDDFQDEPLWTEVNFRILLQIAWDYGGTLIVPMTLTNPDYYRAIIGRLRESGADVRHFVLKAPPSVLEKRLSKRLTKDSWAKKQIPRCLNAFKNPLFEGGINTAKMNISQVAEHIARECGLKLKKQRLTAAWLQNHLTLIKHIRI